jgi:F0F1-type ATP synthase delta subunit
MKKEIPIITITTAQKLSAEQLKALQTLVASKIGEAEYKQVVDPGVIGGLRIAVGNQDFDATIAGKLKKVESQLLPVVVTTAIPLSAEQRKAIKSAIEARLGSVNYTETVDESVIGGIRLLVGSRAFDGTVKGKLTRLKQLLLQTI